MNYRTFAFVTVAAMLSGPALATEEANFSALRGVEAQVLSLEEMQATTGQVNAEEIAAALFAQAQTLNRFPRLKESALRLAQYYLANAAEINAIFQRLGVYTR